MPVSGCRSVFPFVFTRGCRRLMVRPLGRVMELDQQVEPPVPAVGAALLRPSRKAPTLILLANWALRSPYYSKSRAREGIAE